MILAGRSWIGFNQKCNHRGVCTEFLSCSFKHVKEAVKEQMKGAKRNPRQINNMIWEEIRKEIRVENWMEKGLGLWVLLLVPAMLRQIGLSTYSLFLNRFVPQKQSTPWSTSPPNRNKVKLEIPLGQKEISDVSNEIWSISMEIWSCSSCSPKVQALAFFSIQCQTQMNGSQDTQKGQRGFSSHLLWSRTSDVPKYFLLQKMESFQSRSSPWYVGSSQHGA